MTTALAAEIVKSKDRRKEYLIRVLSQEGEIMARYFKLVEIDQDSFIEATGDDLDCLQVVDVCDGIGYIAIADTEEEMTIDLDAFEEE